LLFKWAKLLFYSYEVFLCFGGRGFGKDRRHTKRPLFHFLFLFIFWLYFVFPLWFVLLNNSLFFNSNQKNSRKELDCYATYMWFLHTQRHYGWFLSQYHLHYAFFYFCEFAYNQWLGFKKLLFLFFSIESRILILFLEKFWNGIWKNLVSTHIYANITRLARSSNFKLRW